MDCRRVDRALNAHARPVTVERTAKGAGPPVQTTRADGRIQTPGSKTLSSRRRHRAMRRFRTAAPEPRRASRYDYGPPPARTCATRGGSRSRRRDSPLIQRRAIERRRGLARDPHDTSSGRIGSPYGRSDGDSLYRNTVYEGRPMLDRRRGGGRSREHGREDSRDVGSSVGHGPRESAGPGKRRVQIHCARVTKSDRPPTDTIERQGTNPETTGRIRTSDTRRRGSIFSPDHRSSAEGGRCFELAVRIYVQLARRGPFHPRRLRPWIRIGRSS